MKWMKPLCNLVLPAVLFYIFYHAAGIIPAIVISLVYSVGSVLYTKYKDHKVKNSQIVGIIGLAASAAAIVFTGEEKLYYLPSIIENMIFLGVMIVLSVRHKSVLHYLAKDFEIAVLEQIPEESMFSVNALWMAYFALKIVSKFLGILYLDFKMLYWIVFLLGDPMTIVVVMASVYLIRARYARARKDQCCK